MLLILLSKFGEQFLKENHSTLPKKGPRFCNDADISIFQISKNWIGAWIFLPFKFDHHSSCWHKVLPFSWNHVILEWWHYQFLQIGLTIFFVFYLSYSPNLVTKPLLKGSYCVLLRILPFQISLNLISAFQSFCCPTFATTARWVKWSYSVFPESCDITIMASSMTLK